MTMQIDYTDREYPHVAELKASVNDQLKRPSGDKEAKKAAAKWLKRHRDIRAVADRANGYEDFVISYVQREQTRASVAEDSHPYTGRRDNEVCTCKPSNCALKKGKLPREIRETDHVDTGIREFRLGHSGEPLVLSEARKRYSELMAALEEVYQEAEILLAHGGEPPEDNITVSDETTTAVEVL